MYTRKFMLVALSISLVLSGCATRHPVHRVAKGEKTGQGVYYALPYTKFLVAVPITMSVTTPGKYRDLAKDYFSLSAEQQKQLAVASKKTSFALAKPVITPATVADSEQVFQIQVTAGAFQRRALELKLSNLGLLTDATSTSEDKKLEVALKSIEIVASTVATVFTGQSGIINLEATSLVGPFPNLTTQVSIRQREAAAIVNRIERIQDQRIELLTGNTSVEHVEKSTLDEMLKQLADIEKGLLGQFFGTTKKTTWTAQFLVDPAADQKHLNSIASPTGTAHSNSSENVSNLFCFNPIGGIRPHAKLLEPPPNGFIYDDERIQKIRSDIDTAIAALQEEETAGKDAKRQSLLALKEESAVALATNPIPGFSDTVASNYSSEAEQAGRSGFFYRIPKEGTVRVVKGTAKIVDVKDSTAKLCILQDLDEAADLLRTNTVVAQFGHVISLPISPGSLLKSNYNLTLYEETGSLKTFVSGSEPIDAAFLEQSLKPASAAVGQAVVAREALQSKREAAREAKRQELLQSIVEATEEHTSNASEQAIGLFNQLIGSAGAGE